MPTGWSSQKAYRTDGQIVAAPVDKARGAPYKREQMSVSLQPILSVRDLTVRFGGIVVLDGVSFDVADGQIVGLIGPNGAGKTTLFNCLSRLHTPQRGDVHFRGRSLLGLAPHRIASRSSRRSACCRT